ncbi:UNVERIFIED_CONTAM: hypothetical protein Sradi_4735400 [Sesamum radiatum]|uniref:RING-type domain-containing protein n=1 Tax=Sesamum radiatum TaxID=300843 RepID=A0AAW2MU24_SESRA
MKSWIFFSGTRDINPNPEADDPRVGETSGGGEAPAAESSIERETVAGTADGESDATSTSTTSGEGERRRALMEKPPTDDVCPICFGGFDVPCRAPCGHWYCVYFAFLIMCLYDRTELGSCILQYWNFSASMQPCKCPMCSQLITKLMPEASLHERREVETTKVLQNVGRYNRLFVGGISGFMLKFLAIPLYIKRMCYEMLNPDRPGVYLHEMRVIAVKFI